MTASPQLLLVFDATTAQKFEDFHRSNPNVYRTLVVLARQWVNTTGRRRIGIGALYERARWDLAISTGDADYRLNNNYRAFYSRLIAATESDLRDLFELRSSEADQWVAHYLESRAS